MRVLGRRRPHGDETRRIVAKIPRDAVEPRARGRLQIADHLPIGVEDLQRDGAARRALQAEVDVRAPALRPPERRPRRKQMRRGVGRLRRRLLERRDVVEHVDAAPVGRHDDVVELFLDDDPAHRRPRQPRGDLGPVRAVVVRVEEAVAGAGEELSLLVRILGDGLHVRQRMRGRQIAVHPLPRRAVISRLEDERLAAVDQVRVDGHVRGAAGEMRRLDLRHDAPRRHRGDVLRDVVPRRRLGRYEVHAAECPCISSEFLESERRELGVLFSQEYELHFIDAESAVFSSELISACFVDDFEPFLS